MFSLQGGLQGGPAILSPADQLNGNNGFGDTNVLDIDPFTDKHCARLNSGSYCNATTADGVDLYKDVQAAINAAAGTLKSQGSIELFTPLKLDGVIGPGTAALAFEVLMAAAPTTRTKVWLADPRSAETALMSPLLASQPQFAKETFAEIAETGLTTPVSPVETPATSETPSEPLSPTTPTTTVPAPTPAATAPKVFWTRKKKVIAFAGAGALAVGLLALVLWMRNRAA